MTLDIATACATFGPRLRALRTARGWTCAEFAHRLQLKDRTNISKWENRVSLPTFERILSISAALEVTVDELMRGAS
jgi:transcriptional regulator with XRE-family HTH domain